MLTLNFNTDGAPLTKSGKRFFWPLQICINELQPRLRFKNVLLTGVLLTPKEPAPDIINLFLTPFVQELLYLYKTGITVKYKDMYLNFKFCALNCSVESVCRPLIQNRIQFNGYFGRSWCYQKGTYIHEVRGIRYPLSKNEYPLRSRAIKRMCKMLGSVEVSMLMMLKVTL